MLRTPDWEYWRNMPQMQLWQLVAVSLNVCPKQDQSFADYDVFVRHADRQLRRKFADRLDIAVEHVRAKILPANINAGYRHCDVKLLEFVRWAQDRGWRLPEHLNRLLPEAETPSVAGASVPTATGDLNNEQLHSRTKNNYLRLIQGLCLLLDGYDPRHPFAAAKLIREKTEVRLDERTLAGYITDAYAVACADVDKEQ